MNVEISKTTGLLLFALIVLHLPYFFVDSLHGEHLWRESDVAAVAKNYVVESGNFFLPRVDVRGDKIGITGMEFPLFNYMVSGIYKISGSFWLGFGKILSFFFALLSALILFKIIRLDERINSPVRNNSDFFLLAILLSPFFYVWSIKYMPEFLAMFCALSGFYLFHIRARYRWALLLSGTCLAIALLIRPYYGFFGLPVLLQFFAYKGFLTRSGLKMALLGAFILAPAVIWYGWYVPLLNNTYGISYFYMGSPLSKNIDIIFSQQILESYKRIGEAYVGYMLLPFFVYGLYRFTKRYWQERQALWSSPLIQLCIIAILALFCLPIFIGNHFLAHRYYMGAIFPAVTVIVYYSFSALYEHFGSRIWWLFCILCMIMPISLIHTYRPNKNVTALQEVKNELLQSIDENSLLLTDTQGCSGPYYLYILERKGWMAKMPTDELQRTKLLREYRCKGAQYALLQDKDSNGQIVFSIIDLEDLA